MNDFYTEQLGISGTRFDRQAFDSLLGEVRKGNINCIIGCARAGNAYIVVCACRSCSTDLLCKSEDRFGI